MIKAIFRLQSCKTAPGRRAFVREGDQRHGIASGNIRYYVATGPSWSALRCAIRDCDTTGRQTMGWTNFNASTVQSWRHLPDKETGITIKPLPAGWAPGDR